MSSEEWRPSRNKMLQATGNGTKQSTTYLQYYVPSISCDVNSMGLSISHVSVVDINVIWLFGASKAVPNLQIP